MQESNTVHDEQRRRLMLLGAGAAVVGGWACASRRYVEQPSNEEYRAKRGDVTLSESILGFAYLNNDLQRILQWEDAVALLGKQKTFIISTGKSAFEELKHMSRFGLGLKKDTKLLKFKDDAFWGRLAFTYAGSDTLSKSEAATLTEKGFQVSGIESSRWLFVHGRAFRPMVTQSNFVVSEARPKALDFREPGNDESPPGWPDHDFASVENKLSLMNQIGDFMGLPLFNLGLTN
ncbi:hypothetical protein RQP54_09960 [Curvibacter sp. APW13]|uniref:hypothetical protein n=1 Tax=Curvibacter sp. APW13 TaxID=3077236 RepID=UPI0028DF6EFF|nr:hypothetical protein [Curvibacter sp. APW13]MDT8991188.1 hypothetical protein [Curvibacter sp. APW13]